MLQANNICKSFGDKLILNNISFVINSGQRVGLVGPNGCGKTTLLKIILSELEADSGDVQFSPPDIRIGYLSQAMNYQPEQTIAQVLQTTSGEPMPDEQYLEKLSQKIAASTGEELENFLEAYEEALQRIENYHSHVTQEQLHEVIANMGLQHIDSNTPVGRLSGGQKTRLGLAQVQLANPDLLLLDEPTNHLDFDGLEWLEDFLLNFPGGILLVSHDRAFLDRLINMILELDPLEGKLSQYAGNYSDYLQAKEREREKEWIAYKDQQDFIARLESNLASKKNYARSIEQGTIHFHPRKIAKGIARQAVVQQRRIQRLLDSEERLDKPKRSWQMRMNFTQTPPSGRDVLVLENLSMAFGSQELFHDVSLILRATERVAVVGPNGSGKTTLLRLITEHLTPTSGHIRLGSGVQLGYYAQEQENLDPEATPYEIIRSVAALGSTEARHFLHHFLFGGDDVFVPMANLSLGERARLSLAQLVAKGCNFLLLDEPINHLDIPSRSRFEQALSNFEGTVLMVVHDRYFIDHFATGLWAIKERNIRRYPDRESMRRGVSVPL